MNLMGEVAVVVFLLGRWTGAKKKIGKFDLEIQFFISFSGHLNIHPILQDS